MADLILAIWCAGVICKSIAALRIARSAKRDLFGFVALYLAACAGYSAIRIGLIMGYPATRAFDLEFYAAAAPFMLAILCAAVVSIFRAMTAQYPNFQRARAGFAISLAGIAVGSYLIAGANGASATWFGVARQQILTERNLMLAMMVFLVGANAITTVFRVIPVIPSARAAANIVCVEILLELASSSFTAVTGHRYVALDGLFPVAGGLIAGALWAFYFPRTSDERGEIEAPSPAEANELRAQRERLIAMLPEIKRSLGRT